MLKKPTDWGSFLSGIGVACFVAVFVGFWLFALGIIPRGKKPTAKEQAEHKKELSFVDDWRAISGEGDLLLSGDHTALLTKGEYESKGRWERADTEAWIRVEGPAGKIDEKFFVDERANLTLLIPVKGRALERSYFWAPEPEPDYEPQDPY